MNRILAIFAIGLGLGGGFGFLAAASNNVTLDGHDHGAHGHSAAHGDMHGHDHDAMVDLPVDGAPSLSIKLLPDPVSGWNLHVQTESFRFAPEHAGAPHVPSEGHAHVYVDGTKIARLYGNWMHLAELPEAATVAVTLNSNDHKTLSIAGKALRATATRPAAHD